MAIETNMLRYLILASMFTYYTTAIRLMGGDRDDYDCISSAGYSWCNYSDSCVSVNELCVPAPSPYLMD